ncbi:MAG: hypothetical protein VYD54_06940 [Bdellovibrionota bacterium]|nr:hypothetical protein [Bdellovibrionota bacterium]
MRNSSPFFLIIFCFLFNACQGHPLKEVEVMAYNVENLFDVNHDENKNDWEYLPKNFSGKIENCKKIRSRRYRKKCLKSDWTSERLNLKFSQIKRVVSSKETKKPEILALVEIENEEVVELLAKELGYTDWFTSESPDRRGVDLAILYNESYSLKKLRSLEHTLVGPYFKKRPTRNILEGQFLINGKHKLTVFVNHWPSQGNPTEARIVAAKKLKKLIEERLENNKEEGILAVGDFNILPHENPHPINNVLLKVKGLYDVHKLFMDDPSIPGKEKSKVPLGTYFYPPKKSWNRFDRIFANDFLVKSKDGPGLKLKSTAYKIYNPSFITTTYHYKKNRRNSLPLKIKGIPYRYNFLAKNAKTAGFSDHFPVLIKLKVD